MVTGDSGADSAGSLDASSLDASSLDATVGDATTGDATTGDATTGDATTGDASSLDDATTGDATTGDASSLDDATTGDAGEENPCKVAGGICLYSADQCASGGGSLLPAGDSGCLFGEDVSGVCCEPPAAAPSGDSCEERGGLCTLRDGCDLVDGAFSTACEFFVWCCVPETVCGPEEVECCDETGPASFRPNCDRGSFDCTHVPGTTLVPAGTCLD